MNLFPFSLSFLYLTLLTSITSYTVNEYEIRDLESVGIYFETEAAAWTITNKGSSSASATTCAGTYILGGYQVTSTSTVFQRTFNTLPTHDTIYFSFSVWVLDLNVVADSGALYKVLFDSVEVGTLNTLVLRATIPSSVCGGSGGDYQNLPTSGQVSHSSGSVTVEIQLVIPIGIPQSTASVGFRDLNLLFANTGTTVSDSMCGYTATNVFTNSCLCGSGQYSAAVVLCGTCNPSCASCNGPDTDECQSCDTGYSWDGSECFQCATGCDQCNVDTLECIICDTNNYLYWNGTCGTACDFPLEATTSGESDICSLPCAIGEWYYSEGPSCETSCLSPLVQTIQGDLQICSLPCNTGEWVDWNGQCRTDCNSPFEQGTENGVDVCELPCQDPSTPYYYESDGQCYADCDPPLVLDDQDGFKTCSEPCTTGYFLYWNGNCEANCDDPLVQSNPDVLRCSLPCDADEYFSLDDGDCYDTCDSPLTQGLAQSVVLTCDWTCTTGEWLYWNGNCETDCNDPLVQSTENNMDVCLLPCPIGKWFYFEDDSCQDDCPDPLVQDDQGDLKTCSLPCPDGEYYGWDDNCKAACDDPLIKGVENGVDTCSLPCPIGKWYYFNDTSCYDACDSPLVQDDQGDLKTCSYPCPTGEYFYWNDTCHSGCDSPLIIGDNNGVSVCNLPCDATEFYYLNDSCLSTCDPPFQEMTSGDLKICYLDCPGSEFLYWNMTCQVGCDSPLISSTEAGIDICSLPCDPSSDYYYSNDTCHADCDSPLVGTNQGDLKLCNSPCSSTEYYSLDDLSCVASCVSPHVSGQIGILRTCKKGSGSSSGSDDDGESQLTIALQAMSQTTSSVAVVNNLFNPKSSTSLLVLMLFDLLNYIQYMDITYPSQVEALFDADSDMFSISFSFEYNMTLIAESELPERPIPDVFRKRDLHSSFLVNNWDPLTSMLFAVIAVILYYPIRFLIIKKIKIPLIIYLVNQVENVFRWNLFITFLISDYAEIVLYSALEFISFRASSFLAVFSFLMAVFMIIISIYFLWKTLEISVDITKKGEENHSNEELEEEKWEAYEPLYEPYKNKSMWTQSYMFVLSVRIMLCYMIIAALYRHPILQSVILSLLSFASLIYIIVLKPMNELRELIENLVFEIIILMVNVCVIAIAVFESQEGDHRGKINNLGTAIVVFNTAARILATIFVFYGFLSKLYEIYHKRRKEIRKFTLGVKNHIKDFFKSCWNRKSPPETPSEVKSQAPILTSTNFGIQNLLSKIFTKKQKTQSFKRSAYERRSTLESARDLIRRVFRLNSHSKQVSPEPEKVSTTAKPGLSSRKVRIVPLLSARRNIHNQPLFVATDGLAPVDEKSLGNGYYSGNESLTNKNLINPKQFSEDFFAPNSNKSLLSKRYGGRGSNFISPSNDVVDLGTNSGTSHSLGDFSQSIHSMLKTDKLKTRSFIFDDQERPLPQLSLQKKATKSLFNPVPPEALTQKTLKSRLIGSLYLESPTGNNSDAASSMQNLINRSPKNGRLSPQSQFIEQRNSLELHKEISLEKRNSKNPRRMLLETIPENPKKKSLEEILNVKFEDGQQVNSIDRINNLA